MLIALLVPLCLAIALFTFFLARAAIAARASPKLEAILLGAIVSFFDTLGIGSFAPTTAWLKFRNMVPDRLIPPTMLVGLTPPAMAESVIFLILLGVKVDPVLLIGCAIAVLLLIGLAAGGVVWKFDLIKRWRARPPKPTGELQVHVLDVGSEPVGVVNVSIFFGPQ